MLARDPRRCCLHGLLEMSLGIRREAKHLCVHEGKGIFPIFYKIFSLTSGFKVLANKLPNYPGEYT